MSILLPKVLATDLDGTFIPIDNNLENQEDLKVLKEQLEINSRQLIYVTGRHLSSVQQAIIDYRLPLPDVLICDVGTSIYSPDQDQPFEIIEEYQSLLKNKIEFEASKSFWERVYAIPGIRLQEEEKQGPFKTSFYLEARYLKEISSQIEIEIQRFKAPYSIIPSVDPFNGDGLIDILPSGISKEYALLWWAQQNGILREEIIFSGDSGNDILALTAGFKAIVVGNAHREVVEKVESLIKENQREESFYLASKVATSGVLEGCRYYGLF